MKTYLPKTSNQKGFTLVELMVVISIIAILSVVGYTLYTNAQKAARDVVRKQEIDAIANAMEMNYDSGTAKYAVLTPGSFVNGAIPADVYSGTAKCGTAGNLYCEYCGRKTAGTPMAKGANSGTTCTANGAKVVDSLYPVADTAFEVCATLETSATAYCKTNQR